jgi:hypothetical protein
MERIYLNNFEAYLDGNPYSASFINAKQIFIINVLQGRSF